MPKGLTKEEYKNIREQLIIKGKELIIKYGYKKFGIRDLTKEVGIANGMFYKFFNSKEEIFFLILNKEKETIRKKIYNEIKKYKEQPGKALKSFYYIIIDELNSNPLMKTIFLKNEFNIINNKMTKEQLSEERNKSLVPLKEISSYWKEKGLINNIDIDLVIELLRSLVYLWFHKEEIGEESYPQVIKFMIERICEYVVK